MAQPRTPLGRIDGNIQKKHELTPYQRGKIAGTSLVGKSPGVIAKALKHSKSTVKSTLRRDKLCNNGFTIERPGRPTEYTDRDIRKLVRHVRKNPKHTWQQVRDNCGFTWHKNTLKRMLEPSGITNWRAKMRPELTEAHVQARLAWAMARKDWTPAEWRQYMWSDECSAERGKRGAREWVFRTVGDNKYKPEFVDTCQIEGYIGHGLGVLLLRKWRMAALRSLYTRSRLRIQEAWLLLRLLP